MNVDHYVKSGEKTNKLLGEKEQSKTHLILLQRVYKVNSLDQMIENHLF